MGFKRHNYQVPFNSWFFDTDWTGKLYNEFSKAHCMTQAQDAINRLNACVMLCNRAT
ncbi:glycoside hydrolase [Coxiella endosymbiont of Ornithodoros amblus]|uniref:glycoside hydrolase n=1 Tax=Coxiella endosymbiont of Ornithodoros amblus TaxID=1656166 RepID=UPI003CC70DD7